MKVKDHSRYRWKKHTRAISKVSASLDRSHIGVEMGGKLTALHSYEICSYRALVFIRDDLCLEVPTADMYTQPMKIWREHFDRYFVKAKC